MASSVEYCGEIVAHSRCGMLYAPPPPPPPPLNNSRTGLLFWDKNRYLVVVTETAIIDSRDISAVASVFPSYMLLAWSSALVLGAAIYW